MDYILIATGLGMEQLEIFHGSLCIDGVTDTGWFYGFGQPGCLFDSDVTGPYLTIEEAYWAARDCCETLPEYSTLLRGG